MQHKNNEFETNKRTVDCCVLVPWWWGDTKAMAASMRGAESCRGVCRGRWTSAVQTRESTHRIEGKRAAGGRPRFVREKQEERQPVLRVQGAARGCRDAFGTSMVRGEHKHVGFFRGRRRGDGPQCDDSSGGVGWSIGLVVKEERPPEGSTSWSRSFVWKVMERVMRGEIGSFDGNDRTQGD